MKKLWGKIYRNNRLIADHTVEIRGEIDEDGFFVDMLSAVCDALSEICDELDIENPVWFDSNREEFQRRQKTAFAAGNFMDSVPFDYMEIEIILP